jgi:hypothetical protein
MSLASHRSSSLQRRPEEKGIPGGRQHSEMNGFSISSRKEEVCDVLRGIAEYNYTLDYIERWLRDNKRVI